VPRTISDFLSVFDAQSKPALGKWPTNNGCVKEKAPRGQTSGLPLLFPMGLRAFANRSRADTEIAVEGSTR
jgi:hypothetical protein